MCAWNVRVMVVMVAVVVCVLGRGQGFGVCVHGFSSYTSSTWTTTHGKRTPPSTQKAPTIGAMAAYTSPKGVSGAKMLVWVRTLLPRAVSCHMDRVNTVVQSLATSVGHGGRMLHSAMSSDGVGGVGRVTEGRYVRGGMRWMGGTSGAKESPREWGGNANRTKGARNSGEGMCGVGGEYRNEGRNG